jgi:outer membrane protein OmpA-like peptidoglycan-associated protein
MYIRDYTGFGDPQPTPAETPLLRKAPPYLIFSRISPFALNKFAVTPQLRQQVTRVADYVRSRLDTAQPIGVVRLMGHTDASGNDGINRKLGQQRAEAVRDELYSQLRDVLNRVLIEVEESPGRSKPIGDNRTAKGQAANRRVDVYVAPPIPPAPPWPKGKTYDWTVRDPDRGGIWDQFRFKRGMPDPLGGKTPRQFLMDVCEGKFGKSRCKTVVDKAISAGCTGLEALFTEIGGTLSEDQKEALKKRCKEGADKSM